MMVENKTSDQYLTTGKVSTRSIMKLRRYRLLKTLTKNFNLKSNADADTDTGVTANSSSVLGTGELINENHSIFRYLIFILCRICVISFLCGMIFTKKP